MVHHILTKKEYNELLRVNIVADKDYDDDMKHLNEFFQDCKSWDRKFIGLNHFFSVVLEQFEKRGYDLPKIIDSVYDYAEYISFDIQENNIRFIDKLFNNINNKDLDIDEELILVQNKLIENAKK